MSEIPIQDTPAVPSGAVAPLATDSRTGASNVDSLSFCRGTEVGASSQSSTARTSPNEKAPSDSASINSGMSVSGRQPERARPVDSRTIEGSYAGDHRAPSRDTAAASLGAASGSSKDPRAAVGQAPFGRSTNNPVPKLSPLVLNDNLGS